MSLNRVVAAIKKYNSFVVTSHTNMEGDALGSELAFYFLLKKLGKRAIVINDEDIPYGYEFVPGTKLIRRYSKHSQKIPFDCLALLDCSDLKRTGETYLINTRNKPVLNIDHHVSNSYFGTVNWVDPDASCASEMVYRLYKKMGVAIDADIASALYVGILTDTGSFRFSNTSAFTHTVTAELLRHGIDVSKVYTEIYGNIPLDDLNLFIKILPGMKVALGGKIVWFTLHKQLLRRKRKLCFDLSETLLSFARTLKGMEVALLFRENIAEKNEIRVNLRSQGAIDVNKLANFFGGGGHKNAAGVTIRGRTLEQVSRMVLNKLKSEFKVVLKTAHAHRTSKAS